MTKIYRTIMEIDKDHNGYVTHTELDDILKLNHPTLETRDLLPLLKKFSSVQNRILIDYKGFTNWINLEIKKKQISAKLRENSTVSVRLQPATV